MAKWREEIIRRFTPSLGRSVVVMDPDRLLTEPTINEALREAGFEVLVYEDPIALRFAYESKHRSRADNGQISDLIIVCHSEGEQLPFDVLTRSENVSFSLTDFFPKLSYPIISALEPEYLDTLYEAQERFSPGVLGDNATKDFVLHHIFEIAAELIRSDADLLRVLLRRHYRSQAIPALFIDRVVNVLRLTRFFDEWQLDLLFTNRPVFFSFLQERWPLFLNERFGSPSVNPDLAIPGPSRLPFDSPDVRVYMDNLFTEGLLQPIRCESKDAKPAWILVGIRHDPKQEALERLHHLLALVESSVPGENARHGDWQRFAEIWAQFINLACSVQHATINTHESRLRIIRERVDAEFISWMLKRFGSLHNLPSSPPAMVHHIARHLAHQRAAGTAKIALLVIDGLALDQWITLRDHISVQKPMWQFEQSTVFAWVPSLTSVSRQSIFAARAPFYFPSSIYTTSREASAWAQFWGDHGLSPAEVAYVRALGDEDSLRILDDVLSSPTISALGAVVDKVDRIMHGMELGTTGMHNQVGQWGRTGFLVSTITMLMRTGFDVYIASDHGNVEAKGFGRPREGMLAEVKGERARIFSNEMLRTETAAKFGTAIPWGPLGLPDQYFPLLAPPRLAFIPNGQTTVAHGGITIEEVIVPFVHVRGGVE